MTAAPFVCLLRTFHDTEAEGITLKEQMDEGTDFVELAMAHSKDTRSGPSGGDLGYFTRTRIPERLHQTVFSMKANEISDPVKPVSFNPTISPADHSSPDSAYNVYGLAACRIHKDPG